eukprot:CAMPEP_0197703752 /NCGR_PEP_ID=MMETSP1338-20131121/125595_1 /TAXON_ID=43686 ORGANISM="Pelagodinium beii, Strain RCC1491" /NCGR_SAMPLE_ID=MMETSP1338 /ASSEMBLY_ACC=CAM_ASM_000754 /LENGTH=861 /DNA_ID=CAMNT_0043287651 /DNA_START=88 /DNA_END=2671 /DNA_ORIENTATION=+
MVFISSVLGSLRFAGGLSETDWFNFSTGLLSTSFGWFAYNQNAYCNQVGWRQNQMYQSRNYALSWISVARDDIRELMSVSVNRINNYMIVATLILGIAANCLMWINNFDPGICSFLASYYWLSIGQSMMFLSLAIFFGIKGQNSAFMHTMRLLAWELRPENPADYQYDYLNQVRKWEVGGLKSLLRVPGKIEKYGQEETKPTEASSSNGPGQGAESDKSYEEVEPPTRELIYLERFAYFMRLWVPFEAYARTCIGLGFISLSQGAVCCPDGSHPLAWTSFHNEYREMFEAQMEAVLHSFGIAIAEFSDFCAWLKAHAEIFEEDSEGFYPFLEAVTSAEDYEAFLKVMFAEVQRQQSSQEVGQTQELAVTVPEGMAPGDSVAVEYLGMRYELQVPEGYGPGMTFTDRAGFHQPLQGAAYFCLGNMNHAGGQEYRSLTVTALMAIFTFLTMLIILQNHVTKNPVLTYCGLGLFMAGPVFSLVAVHLPEHQFGFNVMVLSGGFVHFLFFMIVDVILALRQDALTKDFTKKYVEGPHGQRFVYQMAEGSESHVDALPAEGVRNKLFKRCDTWRHGVATGNADAPTKKEEELEDEEASDNLKYVVSTVRSAVSLSAVMWFALFSYIGVESMHLSGIGHHPAVTVTELSASWPNENIDANSITCAGGEVFAVTSYTLLRLSEGVFEEEPCSRTGVFLDIASACDRRGRSCQPLVLMNPSTGGPPQIVDCMDNQVQLLQQKGPPERLAVRSLGTALGNGSVALTMQGGLLSYYTWDDEKFALVPHWQHRAEEDMDIVDMDIVGSHVFKFGSLHFRNLSVVRVENLESGKNVGTWRIPESPRVLSGCSLSGSTLAVLTRDFPPKLLQLE